MPRNRGQGHGHPKIRPRLVLLAFLSAFRARYTFPIRSLANSLSSSSPFRSKFQWPRSASLQADSRNASVRRRVTRWRLTVFLFNLKNKYVFREGRYRLRITSPTSTSIFAVCRYLSLLFSSLFAKRSCIRIFVVS